MRALLVFDLPEETEEHQTAVDAVAFKAAVRDFDEELRRLAKGPDAPVAAAAQWARERLRRHVGLD